jgi:hypothetical protein
MWIKGIDMMVTMAVEVQGVRRGASCLSPPPMVSVLARNKKDTPLFTNIAQESAISRSTHNANVPLLGLPDEVLVHIIKLMQSRFHIIGRAHARRISSYGDTAGRADEETLSWRHLMLVCTRMRDQRTVARAMGAAVLRPCRRLSLASHLRYQ